MSKLDNYLIKKNVSTEKAIPKTPQITPEKVQKIENQHRSQIKHTQKILNYEPPKLSYSLNSANTQMKGISNALALIQLKKSNPKQYKSSNKMELITQREHYKSQATITPALQAIQRMVFPQQILIGPFDICNYEEQIHNLQQLMVKCNKSTVIEWIKSKNQGKESPKDFRNIQMITDEQFWLIDMQRIIELIIKEDKAINSCIRMLPQISYSQTVKFTRKQIFLLIASMFLCIVPPQMNNTMVSFADLMALRPADEKYKQKPPMRLQKLRCVVNYLKFMLKNDQKFTQQISFQRVFQTQHFYKRNEEKPLGNVLIECGKIQSGYGKGIIIDFANSNVGGGFLTNGCAQQEILFSVFPQMIVTKLLCASLRDEQAVIVYGARKINSYEGYSHQFKFKGTYHGANQTPYNSCIVAVDALDYSKGVMSKSMQYGQRFIRRELHKLYIGIKAACEKLTDVNEVYTGRWGCGVFGADQSLKFCIQWIVCSSLGLTMHFFTDGKQSIKQLSLLVDNVKHLSTLDLLSVIESYGKNPGCDQKGFLAFLKYYV